MAEWQNGGMVEWRNGTINLRKQPMNADGVCNARKQSPNSYRRTWILSVGMEEWQNGGIAEWRKGRMVIEWRNGGMAGLVKEWRKWWMAEWRNGRNSGTAERMAE